MRTVYFLTCLITSLAFAEAPSYLTPQALRQSIESDNAQIQQTQANQALVRVAIQQTKNQIAALTLTVNQEWSDYLKYKGLADANYANFQWASALGKLRLAGAYYAHYLENLALENTTGGYLYGNQVGLQASLNQEALQESQLNSLQISLGNLQWSLRPLLAQNTVIESYRANLGRYPSFDEINYWFPYALKGDLDQASNPISLSAEARRVRAEVGAYLQQFTGQASQHDIDLKIYEASTIGFSAVRYLIATSAEAGKHPRLNPASLPLGDSRITYDRPLAGYYYACDRVMFNQPHTGHITGANVVGPWIGQTTYNMLEKTSVEGRFPIASAQFNLQVSGGYRIFSGNALPANVLVGIFPTQPWDPAFEYDRNPNTYGVFNYAFALPENPVIDPTPHKMLKEVGVTLEGIPITAPLDPVGRDELAYEIQDGCGGTTQPGMDPRTGAMINAGEYHYHGQPYCLPNAIKNGEAVVGFALDGIPITSGFDSNGIELITADLDECHGRVSTIDFMGQRVTRYHYVMTRDYPYTVSCFRAKPNYFAFPALPGDPYRAHPELLQGCL